MVDASGKSGVQVSREIGRSDNYLWSMLRNGTMPGLDLFVAIARACGYSVELTGPNPSASETINLSVENGTLYASMDSIVEDGSLDYSSVIDDSEAVRIDASPEAVEIMSQFEDLLERLKKQ